MHRILNTDHYTDMLLNIPLPTYVPLAFFVVLMVSAFYIGSFLEKREPKK